jgi:hypothetical protein
MQLKKATHTAPQQQSLDRSKFSQQLNQLITLFPTLIPMTLSLLPDLPTCSLGGRSLQVINQIIEKGGKMVGQLGFGKSLRTGYSWIAFHRLNPGLGYR